MPVSISGTTGVTTPGLASTAMPTSGGDPVVASGSNSDGEWTQWADGTQICSGAVDNTSSSINNFDIGTYGWSFYSQTKTALFPVAFIAAPNAAAGGGKNVGGGANGGLVSVEGATTTTLTTTLWRLSAVLGVSEYIAIGRWK